MKRFAESVLAAAMCLCCFPPAMSMPQSPAASGAFDGVIKARVEIGDEVANYMNISELQTFGSLFEGFAVSPKGTLRDFTVTLPKAPPAKYLKPVEEIFGRRTSNKNAKIYRFSEIHGINKEMSLNSVAVFKLAEPWEPTQDTWVSFYYADRDVKIQRLSGDDGLPWVIDMNLKKGWNKVYKRDDKLSKDSVWTTAPFGDAKWQLLYALAHHTFSKEFRGEEIQMTACASHYYNYFDKVNEKELHWLLLNHKGRSQTLTFDQPGPDQVGPIYFWHDSPSDVISLEDYNFDGVADIAILTSGIANTQSHAIFLYDPFEYKYVHNSALSNLHNIALDSENEVISTYTNGGFAGRIYWVSSYMWDKGLILIYSLAQDYDPDTGIYTRHTRKLRALKGEWYIPASGGSISSYTRFKGGFDPELADSWTEEKKTFSDKYGVWGWSDDGKAGITEYVDDGKGGFRAFVYDAAAGSVLWEKRFDSLDDELDAFLKTCVERYAIKIEDGMASTISPGLVMRHGGRTYGITLKTTEKSSKDWAQMVSSYSVTVEGSKSKTILSAPSPKGDLLGVSVSGYYISPYEARALVVVEEAYPGGWSAKKYAGCNLDELHEWEDSRAIAKMEQQRPYKEAANDGASKYDRLIHVWGWSRDGKAAIFETGFEGGGETFTPFIFDAVSDTVLDRKAFSNFDLDSDETDAAYGHFNKIIGQHAIEALEAPQPIMSGSTFIRHAGKEYSISRETLERGEADLGKIISSYSISVETGGKSKTILSVPKPNAYLLEVSIAGYYISPKEPRALVIVEEEYPGAYSVFRYVGCSLTAGFR